MPGYHVHSFFTVAVFDDDSKPMFLPARRVGSIVPSVMSVSPGFQATKNFMHANLRQSVPVIRQPYHFGNYAKVS